jgi:large subunit ribosomal protein L17
MRHIKKINQLKRGTKHRKAMLANMACSLIKHKRIYTTFSKAKELKKYIEPLFTKSKINSSHSKRIVFSYLKNKKSVYELYNNISLKIFNRNGGYTRIIKIDSRLGDSSNMALIELVDYFYNKKIYKG